MAAIVLSIGLAAAFLPSRRPTAPPGPPAARPLRGPIGAIRRAEHLRRYVEDLRLIWSLAPTEANNSTHRIGEARPILDRHGPSATGDDLRTWEWFYLHRMFHGDRATLAGHRGAVYRLAYSPDGRWLASAGEDGALVWDIARGAIRFPLLGHADDVNWVAFSPDSARLATASDDQSVRVWDARDGRCSLGPLKNPDKLVAVLFAPDGRRLVTGDRGGFIAIREAATGAEIRRVKVSRAPIEGIDLAPDGSIVAVAGGEDVTLWDFPAMARRILSIPADNGRPHFEGVAFSGNGERFATVGGADLHVRVWNTRTGRLEQAQHHHMAERVLGLAFAPGGDRLLTTGSDQTARLWGLADGWNHCLAGHVGWVWCGAFAPDGRSIATGGGDGKILLWDVPPRPTVTRLGRRVSRCLAMTFAQDGNSVLTADDDGIRLVGESATGPRLARLPFRVVRRSIDAALAPGGERVAVVDAEGTLSIGSPREEEPAFVRPRATSARPCLAFSGDGSILAYVDAGGAVVRLDLAAGRDPRPSAVARPSEPTCLAFAPDGGLLAGCGDGRLVACDAGPGDAGQAGHRGRITCLAVSADGSVCATGGEDAAIVLWDRRTFRVRARLLGHERAIDRIAFTPDGKTMVSVADRVQCWNIETGEPTICLFGGIDRDGWPGRLAISGNGSSIAAIMVRDRRVFGLVWHTDFQDAGGESHTATRR